MTVGGGPEEGVRSLQAGAGGVLWNTCLIIWVLAFKGPLQELQVLCRAVSLGLLYQFLKESHSQGLRKQGQRT